jgi:hypothetical protein
MNEPLPCPWCGEKTETEMIEIMRGQPTMWRVYCDCCGATGPQRSAKRDAIILFGKVSVAAAEHDRLMAVVRRMAALQQADGATIVPSTYDIAASEIAIARVEILLKKVEKGP